MALHFILDGYNVIKQTSLLAEKDLEQGRKGLIKIVETQKPQGSVNNKVTIIFDGKPGVFGSTASSCARILFTSGHSADEKIKDLVDKTKNRKNTVVVTNDKDVRFYVRALGAQVCQVKEFLDKSRWSASSAKGKKKREALIDIGKKKLSGSLAAKINSELKDIWLRKKS